MAKSNGKKRTSPSVERQLALALVAIIEEAKGLNGNDDKQIAIRAVCANGYDILKANGYGDLESVAIRVKRIENEISIAVAAQDGAKLAQLGAALDRAKKGLPPLTTEKKPRTKTPKPAADGEKKKRGGKKDTPALGEVPCHCNFTGCTWKDLAVVDSPCPVCSTGVVADA